MYPNPVVTVSSTGNTNFETFDWLDTTSADAGFYSKTEGGSLGHGNGKVAADLEYFYHGEIGDFYRMNNYPYNITTKYMVDPSNHTIPLIWHSSIEERLLLHRLLRSSC